MGRPSQHHEMLQKHLLANLAQYLLILFVIIYWISFLMIIWMFFKKNSSDDFEARFIRRGWQSRQIGPKPPRGGFSATTGTRAASRHGGRKDTAAQRDGRQREEENDRRPQRASGCKPTGQKSQVWRREPGRPKISEL